MWLSINTGTRWMLWNHSNKWATGALKRSSEMKYFRYTWLLLIHLSCTSHKALGCLCHEYLLYSTCLCLINFQRDQIIIRSVSTDNSCKRKVASFRGCSHLQFLDRCSMLKWRGKAWEIKSHAWRQVDMRVDMKGGRCLVKNLEVLLVQTITFEKTPSIQLIFW